MLPSIFCIPLSEPIQQGWGGRTHELDSARSQARRDSSHHHRPRQYRFSGHPAPDREPDRCSSAPAPVAVRCSPVVGNSGSGCPCRSSPASSFRRSARSGNRDCDREHAPLPSRGSPDRRGADRALQRATRGSRERGHGLRVTLTGNGWRESKVAYGIRSTRQTVDHDPQPRPPECFTDPRKVLRKTIQYREHNHARMHYPGGRSSPAERLTCNDDATS